MRLNTGKTKPSLRSKYATENLAEHIPHINSTFPNIDLWVKAMNDKKVVPVVAYKRYRLGRWEDVCKHFRSPPRK